MKKDRYKNQGGVAALREPAAPEAKPTTRVDLNITDLTQLSKSNWVTDGAWICGVVGAVAVVLFAAWFNVSNALERGVFVFGWQLTDNRLDSLLTALLMITGVMVAVELARLYLREKRAFFQLAPDLSQGNSLRFFINGLANYLLYLALLGLVILFFRAANEYGYTRNAPYYQPWFRFLELAWTAYLWLGLPYGLLTRALKHNPLADRRDLATSFGKVLMYALASIPGLKALRPVFDDIDKKNGRGLLVKLFFAPLMTVFFCDQFPHLVRNVGYLFDGLPNLISSGAYTHSRFNSDFFNISIALIFSIDVALAWCGYIISSRWVDNQTASAEPTVLGWLVCIMCYPPFQMFLGLYFSAPGERAVLQVGSLWLVTIFTSMMVASYVIYMAATLWFGVRFSNLTNRGIIRKGPFAWVRHPAYASKNFAWWCVMFPAIIYNINNTGWGVAGFQIIGLLLMTGVYYLRALTEERHLMADPHYQAYCQQVKYRFIPGVI